MSWSFFKKQNDFHIAGSVLVIDIRSSSVGGAIVEFSRNKTPLITQTYREHYFFETPVEPEVFFKRAEVALKKVLETLLQKRFGKKHISDVEIFYGAPWYKSSIANIKIEQTAPTECTSEFIDAIIQKDTAYNIDQEIRIEKELLATLLDGYAIQKPLGKKASHFEFSFFTSTIAKDTFNNFIETVKKHTRTQFIHSHTHPYTMFRVLDKALQATKHYAILDVGSEMLELSIIKDDHFKKIISIPYGSHYFVRAYAKLLSTDFSSAFMRLKNSVHEEADEKIRLTQENFLKEIRAEMSGAIQKVFKDHNLELLPNIIFVAGDEEVRELVLHLLNEVDIYAGAFKINRKPTVQFIASDIMKTYCAYVKDARVDHQLAAEAVYVELLRVDKEKI